MLMWFIIYSFILKSHPLCVTFYSCYSLKCALSFSGGSISTSEVVRRRYVGFSSVCLHASPIDLNTAVTTIWRQREACWRNDNSISFRLLFLCSSPVWSPQQLSHISNIPSDVPTNPGHLTPTFSCTPLTFTSPADTPAPHYPITPSVFVCSCHLFPCYLFTTGLLALPLWTCLLVWTAFSCQTSSLLIWTLI